MRIVIVILVIMVLGTAATGFLWRRAAEQRLVADAITMTGGNPVHGKELATRHGCAACHTISKISQPKGLVGPPLDNIRERVYLGGVLPNTADNMIAWLQDPPRFAPKTAMPRLGLNEAEARDITAFLYTLR